MIFCVAHSSCSRSLNRLLQNVFHRCQLQHACASTGSAPQSAPTDSTSSIEKMDFMDLQTFRRNQAHRSLLVQVSSVETTGSLEKECRRFGNVQSLHHYRQHDKDFVLVEMDDRKGASELLQECSHWDRDDLVPVRTRLLDGSSLKSSRSLKSNLLISEHYLPQDKIEQELHRIDSVSDQMRILFEKTKLTELGTRLRYFIASQLEDTISGTFPSNRVYLFGSSVNGFGHHHSDMDMILDFDVPYSEKRKGSSLLKLFSKMSAGNDRAQIQRSLELLADHLQYLLPGYSQIQRILLARVPIVKFTHDVSGVKCDLSITNMTGLIMSSYLYTVGQIDPRFRILMVTIRRWAQANHLTNVHPGRWITNFTLTIMAVFFMQQKRYLPPLGELEMTTFGTSHLDPSKGLDTLLKEFFAFYSRFDFKREAMSVIDGKLFNKPDFSPLYIENPVEPDLNIARNLSGEELERLVTAMRNALWNLESSTEAVPKGILKLFSEASGKSPGLNMKVDRLFVGSSTNSSATGAAKYQPDEFVVESHGSRISTPRAALASSIIGSRRSGSHNVSSQRLKLRRGKESMPQRPIWTKF